MFGHLISKQAQVTGGISRARALASKSTLHEEAENRGFRKLLCSDVCVQFRPVHVQAAIPELFSSQFEIVIAPPIC